MSLDLIIDAYGLKIKDIINKMKYDFSVPKEKHLKNIALCNTFLGELLDYFKDDLKEKVKPLKLTPDQLNVLHFAIDSKEKGWIKNIYTTGRVFPDKQYYLLMEYDTKGIELDSEGEKPAPDKTLKYAWMYLEWNVTRESPLFFEVSPLMDWKDVGRIAFWIFKEKITTPEQLDFLHLRMKGMKESFRLYDEGNRIVHNLSWDTDLGEKDRVTHSYLIGNFNSKVTQSTQWLYGFNKLIHERRGEPQPLELRPKF
jgi:hypothetical protein